MMAVAIIAFTGVLLLIVFYERVQFTLTELLALVPLCLNPYFIGCLSFKYDAPYMAISILAGVLPLLYRHRSTLLYISSSVIGTLIMCTSYQASSGIYPMVVILMMLHMWNRKENIKQIITFCVHSIIGYGVGILIFKLTLMPSNYEVYLSNSLPSIKEFIPTVVKNLSTYYEYVITDFKPWWIIIILLVMFGFIYTTVIQSEQDKIVTLFITIASVICMGLLCFGMYPALESPIFNPRAMYGFSVFITLLGVDTAKSSNALVIKSPILLLGWTFLVFAFTYGNALSVQKDYVDFKTSQVIDDLNDMEILESDNEIAVQIEGEFEKSPILQEMPQNYQILNRLIEDSFFDENWGTYKLFHYYNLNIINNKLRNKEIDLTTYNLPMLEDHMYYTIYGNDSYILIKYK
jgi:hypothetical protein